MHIDVPPVRRPRLGPRRVKPRRPIRVRRNQRDLVRVAEGQVPVDEDEEARDGLGEREGVLQRGPGARVRVEDNGKEGGDVVGGVGGGVVGRRVRVADGVHRGLVGGPRGGGGTICRLEGRAAGEGEEGGCLGTSGRRGARENGWGVVLEKLRCESGVVVTMCGSVDGFGLDRFTVECINTQVKARLSRYG